MTKRIEHLNAFIIFCVFPWLAVIAPAAISYALMLVILILNKRFALAATILSALAVVYYIVENSPVRDYLEGQELLNTYNASFALSLIFLIPFFKKSIVITTNRATDFGMLLFFLTMVVMQFSGNQEYRGTVQIMAYTFAVYFCFANKVDRSVMLVAYLFVSGARAIIAGFAVAWLFAKFKHLRASLSLPVLVAVVAVISSGSLLALVYEYLVDLRAQSILLKGRTIMWLAMLDNSPGLFGSGAGSALVLLADVLNYFQLPHNDWLRIYTDFGIVGLAATIAVFFHSARKNENRRFATIVLAFYMLTGNPLSFPTVIATYFLVCQTSGAALQVRSGARLGMVKGGLPPHSDSSKDTPIRLRAG